MTYQAPGQFRKIVTNNEVFELLRAGESLTKLQLSEPLEWLNPPIGRALELTDCFFPFGLTIRRAKIARDVSFNRSIFNDICTFSNVTVSGILSLLDIIAPDTLLHFEDVQVSQSEEADIWLRLQKDSTVPELQTDDGVILEMLRRAQKEPGEIISYKETKDLMGN